ncbi:MAG: transcription elongation factor GreA [Bacteriovoracaceae bacterium]|nr:transcription elongation factor GreA [Bacteriovoracaceae bacterium]
MNEEYLMTPQGKKILDEELERLIKVERESIKTALIEARAHGDLKENAEYHSAKEKQSLVEGKISELQNRVAKAKVIDPHHIKAENKVVFGATVKIFDLQNEVHITYTIVGEDEAKNDKTKISYKSPLGMSLIGKDVGDVVVVKTPKGDREYEIESATYA